MPQANVPPKLCTIPGCDGVHLARGWCSKHYQRWKIHRDPLHEPPTVEERLLARTRKTETCWFWEGDRAGSDGAYGVISEQGRPVYVHRKAHELWVGPIPDGFQVDHVADRGCTSPLCVNPAHLEAVTPEENRRRSRWLPILNREKTHCIHGHEFTPENTRHTSKGHRQCRACGRETMARLRQVPKWQEYYKQQRVKAAARAGVA